MIFYSKISLHSLNELKGKTMAATFEQIVGYLEKAELKFDYMEDKKVIVLMTSDEDSSYGHFIRLREDGELFEWQMQILDENHDSLKVKEHQYLDKFLTHMLYINYNTKFGTWEYDPSDGDCRLVIEIPLEDALMTEKQFMRISSLMLRDADTYADELLHILETGEFPKKEDDGDMIAQLEAMLAKLKGSKTDSSEDGI